MKIRPNIIRSDKDILSLMIKKWFNGDFRSIMRGPWVINKITSRDVIKISYTKNSNTHSIIFTPQFLKEVRSRHIFDMFDKELNLI